MAHETSDVRVVGRNASIVRFGVFELDVRTRELRKRGLKVRLPDQAFRILQLLLERPGEVVTRDELRQRLWSADTFVDYELSINTAIRKLREALGDVARDPRFIETLPRVGYRFLTTVERPPACEVEPSTLELAPARGGVRQLALVLAACVVLGGVMIWLVRAQDERPAPAASSTAQDGETQDVNPEAHVLYAEGIARRGAFSYEALQASVLYLERAVAMQPDFARAHAGLAFSWLQFLFVGPMTPDEVLQKVEAAASRAIALEDSQAEAHHALAVSRLVVGDRAGADDESRRAFELDPSRAVEPRVLLLLLAGRVDNAVDVAVQARDVDPQSVNAAVTLSRALAAAGRDQEAEYELNRALEMQPNRPNVWFQLGARRIVSGEVKPGIAALEKAVALSTQRNPRFRAYLGYAFAVDGQTERARAILSELIALRDKQYVSSFGIALIHEALGEKAAALTALERAADEHALEFIQFDLYPPFTTLTSEPRFERLMQRTPTLMARASRQ